MRKREPIVFDPGWVTAGTPRETVITDLQAHLRGCGVVTPPQRYPNREPRLSAPELTSDCVVKTATGDVLYTIKRATRKRSTGRTTVRKVQTVHAHGTSFAMDYATLSRVAGTIGNTD